tara:strand:- start:202 stop:642 length:441 start_codon:yes stop_codon:yes gene_type:complete
MPVYPIPVEPGKIKINKELEKKLKEKYADQIEMRKQMKIANSNLPDNFPMKATVPGMLPFDDTEVTKLNLTTNGGKKKRKSSKKTAKSKYAIIKQKNGKTKKVIIKGIKKVLYKKKGSQKKYVKSNGRMMNLTNYKKKCSRVNNKK